MGSDPAFIIFLPKFKIFQSTLPGWGATGRETGSAQDTRNFNPRSPDGERQACYLSIFRRITISIHAPRMGSDHNIFSPLSVKAYFNPRSPDGERLFQPVLEDDGTDISIHAPRMGSDRDTLQYRLFATISIHAPRMGSDTTAPTVHSMTYLFQSTLPGWGATAKMDIFAHDMGKIIHFQH